MDAEVLIVGAGPTGLVLACELARRGVPHRLIERSSRPAEGSRGKGVQPRSLELLDDLGVARALVAGGRFDMPMLLHGKDGSAPLAAAPPPPPREGAPYASPLLTPQWRVEGLLRDRLLQLGGSIEWGVELLGIEQEDERVIARVRAGDAAERIAARWLVGCDGGHSTVRKTIAAPFVGETLERIRMWVGDLTLEGLDRDHWHLWRGPYGFLALCPLPDADQFQFQAQVAAGETREPSLAAFADLIRERTGRDDIRVCDVGWMSAWRANVRMVERFRTGRVLLAGDAAHVHSPAGAQGMNTGMQDAFNLGWKLAAVHAGADADLIDTYQEERLPVARGVLDLSSALTRTAFSPDRQRDERTSQLDLSYRHRRLSVDVRPAGAAIRAGDRAPDATGLRGPDGVTRRLFDLLRGPQATVLVFGGAPPPALAATLAGAGAAVRCVRIVAAGDDAAGWWADADGAVERLYAAAADAMFVIRPDGYVGLTGSTADHAQLGRYLRRIVGTSSEGAR